MLVNKSTFFVDVLTAKNENIEQKCSYPIFLKKLMVFLVCTRKCPPAFSFITCYFQANPSIKRNV